MIRVRINAMFGLPIRRDQDIGVYTSAVKNIYQTVGTKHIPARVFSSSPPVSIVRTGPRISMSAKHINAALPADNRIASV
jgi:hypothetical protein